jgi:hypothetical protein
MGGQEKYFSGVNTEQLNFGVQTLTLNGVAPIPEPETYAMLMAGLGLLGAVARRKK